MPRASSVLVALICLFQNGPAFAWGDLGHQTVAMIAQSRLTPEARAWVESVLGPEPLSVAAIWPDQVRDDGRYKEFASYHLCDVSKGATGDYVLAGDPHHCLSVFKRAPAILSDPAVSADTKRIVFRYLIHVAGDVHQPLHVGNGYDLGANLCDIKLADAKGKISQMNLHGYWDSNVVSGLSNRLKAGSRGWFGPRQLADVIAKRAKDTPADEIARLVESTPEQWIADSASFRRLAVYPDPEDTIFEDERHRPYCKFLVRDANGVGVMHSEFYRADAVPVLSPKVQKLHQDLAEKQIFKGGIRLAALLNAWAPRLIKNDHDPMMDTLRLMQLPAVPTVLPSAPRR